MKATILQIAQLIRSTLKYSFLHHVEPTSEHSEKSTLSSEATCVSSNLHGSALAIATQLNGKVLHLSDLTKVFASWPTATNKHVRELETLVDSLLERVVTNERKLKALKQADFARLMSLWYPDAEWPELLVATAYSVWIFVWDDEIDAGDTDAANHEELAQAYYKQSLAYIHSQLGLDKDQKDDIEAPHQNMALFADVGRGLLKATDTQQRQRFFDELENFMLQVGVEHSHRMAGTMPTTDEYMEIRSGSVGCAPQIAITDYMLKIRLPETIMECAVMRSLWRETVYICLILNDVYSVQKEILQGSLLNIVPVIFHNMKRGEMDAVSRDLDVTLKESMERFEAAAEEFRAMAPEDSELHGNILNYIKWCRYFITGVLYWSLESRRYGMAKCINADGTLSIRL
ncbi:terpenoid synthase [Xylaria bambusicola]|uniref:terpenoid synthase n=1 Tax=Xylaria bambusicola TaxID=326684 RepID=UPI002008924F|nr:terpenoid synthase [Xylaria bambusicola]KAI0522057.1 terpenoid synthase [Xylaria bambusicola]